jgi:outer membrane protein assembly factor BamB
MTDQQLLQLLEEKMPEELTLEEIEWLQRRLKESPTLRDQLAGEVHFESYLQAAMARLKLSPELIAARARAQQRPRSMLGISLVLLLVMGVLGGAGYWAFLRSRPQPVIAENENSSSPKLPVTAAEDKSEQQATNQPDKSGTTPSDATPAAGQAVPRASQTAATKLGPGAVKAPPGRTVAPVPLPWQSVVESREPPPKFSEVAFQRFDLTKEIVRREQLQPWFEAAHGQNYRLHEVDTQFGKCAALEGTARLKSPWLADSLLRLALENYNKLQIHLYHGNQGVTLVYHQDQSSRWAAYVTTRKPKTTKPETLSLASTDDLRCFRTEIRFGGPLDLRYHEGQVILSRGDIVLLAAPLPGPPDDVYFEGRATFYGLQFLRTSDAPESTPEPKVAYSTDRPAELSWTSSQPEVSTPQLQPDGSVTFQADNAEKHLWCWTPLPKRGLHEVVLQVTDVTPGFAVYLGREQGRPSECVRFLRNRRTNRLIAKLRGVDGDHEIDASPYHESVEGCAQQSTLWLKLCFGCGTFRWSISADGKNWGQPDYIRESLPGQIDSLGMFLVAKRPGTRGTIKRLELRELSGLSSLASEESKSKALALPAAGKLDDWRSEVARQKPADCDEASWRIASALNTLAAGTTRELGYPLLELLLDEPSLRSLPLDQQLAVHADALQLVGDLKEGMRVNLFQRFASVGQNAFIDHNLGPWSSVRRTYMSAPIHTINRPGGSPLAPLEQNVRTELLQHVYSGDSDALLATCDQMRFFHVNELVPLIPWAEAMARRDGSTRGVVNANTTVMRDGWRPLLVEELNKETYNLTSELQAVLDSESWDDAARIITSIDPEAAPGVAPYVKDRNLLTSLPVAVELLLRDYPRLREALGERFGPLAKLRIGQAMASADASAVELATVQFGSTPESAEALRWLGDRALSNGWFEEAIVQYETAIARHPSLAAEIAPRIRLAGAMLGRDVGTPVTSVVQFNDLKLDAAAFETLVSEMRARGTSAAVGDARAILPGSSFAVPPPAKYTAHIRSRLDGPVGDRPQEEVGRKTNQYAVPWADKQIAATVEGDTFYVTNRFQVAAYDLNNGQRKWQSHPPSGSMQKSQDFALMAMRPLVLRDHILARQLYSRSQQLVCLEKSNGKLLWAADRGEREFFCSDPVYLHGQLVALSLATQEQQEGVLRWNVLDPATGELLQQRDLVRLRNTWGSRACCEVLALDHQVVVVLGGITLAVDARGQIAWVRKQVTVPSEEDPRWVLQNFQRPFVVAGQLIVSQPGVRTVTSLDPATGTHRWEKLIPDVIGCLGGTAEHVIVQTETGILALRSTDGQRSWSRTLADLQPFALVDEKSVLVAQKVSNEGKTSIQMTWLDTLSGETRAESVFNNLNDNLPRLGLLIPHQNRLFSFFGRGQHDPQRDVVEFVADGQ